MYVDANPHLLACENLKNGTVANIESEGFPLLVFLSFIIIPCFFYPIYFTVPYRLYLRNSVTWLCIILTSLLHFWNNIVIVH